MTFNDIFKSSFLEKVSSFSLVDALIALARFYHTSTDYLLGLTSCSVPYSE